MSAQRVASGAVFGRLRVSGRVAGQQWLCRCECGGERVVYASNLSSGRTRSCGCLAAESRHACLRHGHSQRNGIRATTEYYIWSGILQRCRNPNDAAFKNYGGRGISVCERWLSFENFLADMGPRPVGKSIDRRDNNKGYSPENCRWATPLEQGENRRDVVLYDYNGARMSLKAIARVTDIKYATLRRRVVLCGQSVATAVSVPVGSWGRA